MPRGTTYNSQYTNTIRNITAAKKIVYITYFSKKFPKLFNILSKNLNFVLVNYTAEAYSGEWDG